MSLADLLEALDRTRVEPSLVCPPYTELDPLVERASRAGVPCRARLTVEGSWDFRGKKAFRRLVRGFSGILHFNLGSLDSCRHHLLALPRGGRGVSTVATLHSLTPLRDPGVFRLRRRRRALGRLSRLAAVSRAAAERASDYLPPERICVAPNFLAPRSLAEARRLASGKRALRERLGIPGDALVGICVGPLSPFKGQEMLVDLLPRVLGAFPGFLLLLVGGDRGGRAEGLLERARSDRAGEAVRWVGWRDDTPAWLAASDLLLLPGGPEGFSRVVLEAMAAGIPSVAFRHGGVLDLVREGETGLLADPGDQEAFLNAWLRILGDGEGRRRMGGRAAERAEEFAPSKTLEVLYGIYREAALKGRPVPPTLQEPSRP